MKMPISAKLLARLGILHRGSKTYDFLAATPVIVWFTVNVVGTLRHVQALAGQLLVRPDATLALTLLSKCAVVLFAIVAISMLILRQPPQSGARGIAPRVAGLLGTYLAVA